MLTLLPKSFQTKLKLFLLMIFSICYHCQRSRWCTLSCEYLCGKFVAVLLGYSGAWGKLIYEKLKVKNLGALSLKVQIL